MFGPRQIWQPCVWNSNFTKAQRASKQVIFICATILTASNLFFAELYFAATGAAGLPDGTFSNQKSKIWENFEGLRKKKVGVRGHFLFMCYGHLVG
jgi:hypothetical protein